MSKRANRDRAKAPELTETAPAEAAELAETAPAEAAELAETAPAEAERLRAWPGDLHGAWWRR